jgi:hypothetical protein
MELSMRCPGCIDIDLERAILDTADILLHWLKVPGYRQVVSEKNGRDCRPKESGHTWYEGTQRIEHGYHLRSVTESMSGDRTPNAGQGG